MLWATFAMREVDETARISFQPDLLVSKPFLVVYLLVLDVDCGVLEVVGVKMTEGNTTYYTGSTMITYIIPHNTTTHRWIHAVEISCKFGDPHQESGCLAHTLL